MERPYVVIRTQTDPTGHVDVSVVEFFVGTEGGLSAEKRAHRLKDRLNQTARQDLMEAFIVREVGASGDPTSESD